MKAPEGRQHIARGQSEAATPGLGCESWPKPRRGGSTAATVFGIARREEFEVSVVINELRGRLLSPLRGLEKLGALYPGSPLLRRSDPGLYAVAPFGGFRTRQAICVEPSRRFTARGRRPRNRRCTFSEERRFPSRGRESKITLVLLDTQPSFVAPNLKQMTCQTKSVPGPRRHFGGEIVKIPEVLGVQWVARKEVSCKAVENEKQRCLSGWVVKRPNLSACRIRGLERAPLELP